MNPELQQIINEMAVGGASQQEINEVARRYEAGLPLYGDQPVMSGFQQDIARKRSRGRNPFLNILGEIGDFTGLTKENISQGLLSGRARAKMYDETKDVFRRGADLSDAELQEYIDLVKKSEEVSQIESYQRWSDAYDNFISQGENHATAAVMATKQEGTSGLLAVMLQSFAGLTNAEIGAAGLATAAPAAAAGSTFFGLGAVPTGLAGFFGGANAAAETMITFTGLLQEELENQDLDFTPDNIRRVLSDDKTKKKIRNKSLGRGVTIGVVEGATTALGVKGATSIGTRVVKATKSPTLGVITKGTVAGVSEMTGGALGESAGLIVEGKPLDPKEIIVEGIAGIGGAPVTGGISVLQAAKNKPTYKVNGTEKNVTRDKVEDIITTSSPLELMGMKIEIKNDPTLKKLYDDKVEDGIIDSEIDSKISNKTDRAKLVELRRKQQKAEADAKKTGVFKVLGAQKRLNNINTEIDQIMNEYEGFKEGVFTDLDIETRSQKIKQLLADTKMEAGINFAKKYGGLYDLKVVDDLTTKQIIKKYGKKFAEASGFVSGKELVINREIARQVRDVNIGNHELLHGILKKAVQEGTINPELIKDFRSKLTAEQNALVDQRIKENSDVYTEEYLKKNPDEYLTIFSDLVKEGEIDFKDRSNWQKFGDLFLPVFRAFGYDKIGFKDGNAVYEFMREYNESTKKGILSSAIKRAATEKTKTALTAKLQPALSEVFSKKALTRDSKAIDNQLVKDKSFENEIQEAYESGAYDKIQEKYKSRIKRILRANYSWIEDFDRQNKTNRFDAVVDFATGDPDRGVLGIALKYDKNTGVPMSGWIGSVLKRRGLMEAVNSEFKEGTVEQFMGARPEVKRKAEAKAAPDVGIVIDRASWKERESELRKKLKLDKPMIETVKNAVTKVLGARLPSITTKQFKTALVKAFRVELKKPIQDMIGTREKFKSFLKEYRETIATYIPVATLVRFERNVKPENRIFTVVVDTNLSPKAVDKAISEGKLPKDTNRNSGPTLYELRMPSEEEILNFYTGENVGASTKGTRKDALATELGVELALDATLEVLQTPEVLQRRREVSQLQKQEQFDNDVQLIAKQIERDPNVKFKVAKSKDYIAQIQQLQKLVNDAQSINDVYDIKKQKVKKEIKFKSQGKEYDFSERVQVEVLNAVINDKLLDNSWFQKTVKKISKLMKITPKMFKDNGKAYEWHLAQKFKALAKKIPGLEVIEYKPGETIIAMGIPGVKDGTKIPAPDLMLKIGDIQIPIELKFGKAKMGHSYGSVTNFKKKQSKTSKTRKNPKHQKLIEKAYAKVLEKAGPLVNMAKAFGIDLVNSKTKVPFEKHLNIQNGMSQSKVKGGLSLLDMSVEVDGDFVAEHYNSKGVYYIHINGKGVFYIGSDPLGIAEELGIGKLEGKFPLAARLLSQGYGKDKAKGIPTQGYTYGITAEPVLEAEFVTSETNLNFDEDADVKSLVTSEAVKNESTFSKKNISPDKAKIIDEAIKFSRKADNPVKGMSVWDFDDTIARSKSNVLYTAPDGVKGKLTAEQFADQGAQLLEQGYDFDFSEFSKVVKGEKGPFFKKFVDRIKKFGVKDNFILTARPVDSAPAIKAFLESQGINIPLGNINALGNSTAEAKALWIAEKIGKDSYNDIYFADDALQNVQAVKNMMEQMDVKGKVQQANVKFSKKMNKDFNKIIEDVSGIPANKRVSNVRARKRGAEKGRFAFFVPPSAEDFVGLLYHFLGKGKVGEKHMAFFKKALIDPLNRGYRELNQAKQSIAEGYNAVKKKYPEIRKKLNKKIGDTGFTHSDAIRVYLWDKFGFEIPGLDDSDIKELVDLVKKDIKLQNFADRVGRISKRPEGYVEPNENWISEDIRNDLIAATDKIGRKEFFAKFIENKKIIFSNANLNKIEEVYGTAFRDALEDMLYRIENGTNRTFGKNRFVNNFMDWINGSVGATMFFNARSAVLQTISTVNFINWNDNNIFKAAKAFADQKQFWSDFSMIFNSDMLKQRRRGLKTDINAAELAGHVKNSKQPIRSAVSFLLNKGFLPTQIADSFAIAFGGASMYRNRVNTYKKQGLSQKRAERKAFLDFADVAEETQQSARPDRVSQQQASVLGRLILAFQNTPMQYVRLIKKASLDLAAGRGDAKTHISKIIYYGFVQNVIFYSLQSAVFAMMFGDDDDEKDEFFKKKKQRVANGMMDTILRGMGITGAIVSTVKNMALKFAEQKKKPAFKRDEYAMLIEALNVSPPIGIKASKLLRSQRAYFWNEDVIKHMNTLDIDNPMWEAVGLFTEATTNVPLNRLHKKANNIRGALNAENEAWQRVALSLGWSAWDLGIENKKMDEIKDMVKLKKKYPDLKEDEIEKMKKSEEIFKLNKSEQVDILGNLGLNTKEIQKLKYEKDRVNKILELKYEFPKKSKTQTNKTTQPERKKYESDWD